VRLAEIPDELVADAKAARQKMIESIADLDDAIAERYLHEQECTPEDLIPAIRRVTVAFKGTPVLMGSAYKNKGVQLLLDAVRDYLPMPSEVENIALDQDHGEAEIKLESDTSKPFVGWPSSWRTAATDS